MSVARATAAADDNRSKHQLDANGQVRPMRRNYLVEQHATSGLRPCVCRGTADRDQPDRNGCSSRSNVEKREQFRSCAASSSTGSGTSSPGISLVEAYFSSPLPRHRRRRATPRRRQRDHAILDLHPIETPAHIVKARIGRTSRWSSTGLQTALTSASFEPPVTLRR